MLTAYDFPSARLVTEAGIDLILVGDSLGMVVLGYGSTLPVTMDDMVHHTKATRRGAPEAFVNRRPAVPLVRHARAGARQRGAANEGGGCRFGEARGGVEIVPIIEALARAGVPVLGHVGLTPQTASALGGYKLQGKDEENARRIMEGAQALERAGCWAWCWSWCLRRSRAWSLSASPSDHRIGAGAHCDGQVLVFHDLVGLFSGFTPSFVKRYAEAGAAIKDAVARYAADVRNGSFPAKGRASA